MKFSEILLQKISYYLRDRNEKISIAESVTSGCLQLAFSEMPSAEQFFEGGLTVYTIDQKVKQLNIDYDEAKTVNCVSKNVTEVMALNVAKLYGTEWSIATTGYSTPTPESGNEIFAFYAVSYKGEVIVSDRIDLQPLTKPMDAQNYFAECALSCLTSEIKRHVPKAH